VQEYSIISSCAQISESLMTGLYLPPECLCSLASIEQTRRHCGGSTSRTEGILMHVGQPTAKRRRHPINSTKYQNTTVPQFLSIPKLKRRILNFRCHANRNVGRLVGFKHKDVNHLKHRCETRAKLAACCRPVGFVRPMSISSNPLK
jgi:hypothetical protein